MSSGWWHRPRHLTEESVLARNGPGFVRRVVALEFPTVVPESQPLHRDSLARAHDEHLAVKRLSPARVEHDQVAVANRRPGGRGDSTDTSISPSSMAILMWLGPAHAILPPSRRAKFASSSGVRSMSVSRPGSSTSMSMLSRWFHRALSAVPPPM